MSKRFVYLAYPLDNANLSQEHIAEINKTKRVLLEDYASVVVYDPGDAWTVAPGSQVGPEISAVNNTALDAADAVVAFLPRGAQSIGVPMEIARAGLMGKPVAVISDYWSWALAGGGSTVQVFAQDRLSAALEWVTNAESYLPITASSTEPMPVLPDQGTGDYLMPTRTHADDAGLDLYVKADTFLPWGEFVDVPCGVRVELPSWSWGLLVGRSSTFRRRQIEVQLGVIDAGYRGELFAACIWRPSDLIDQQPQINVIKAGERLAQLIIIPNGTRDIEPVKSDELTEHDRGENGFGSSGA